MPRFLAIPLLGLLALCSDAASRSASAPAGVLALTDVTVIDGTGAAPMAHMTVLVEGDRIARTFRAGSEPLPAAAEVLSLSGHYLLPGLIDAHSHLASFERGEIYPALLRSMLLGGVTTMRDMGGNTRRVADLAPSVRAGELASPRLFYSAVVAGPEWFASYDPERIRYWSNGLRPGSAPGVRMLEDSTDVDALVDEAVGLGVTGIKVYADVAPARLAAVADA